MKKCRLEKFMLGLIKILAVRVLGTRNTGNERRGQNRIAKLCSLSEMADSV